VPNEEEYKTRVERYRRLSDVLLALTVTGCYWDERPGKGVWEDFVQRIANPQSKTGGTYYPLWDEGPREGDELAPCGGCPDRGRTGARGRKRGPRSR
jgi:hypothetical protein